jgi:hypothetical protein
MAAGLSSNVTLASVNQSIGARMQLLEKALSDLADFKLTWLDPNGSAGLTALGMAEADVNVFFAAVQDAYKLHQVLHGQATVSGGAVTVGSGGYNFSQFISKCIGVGVNF